MSTGWHLAQFNIARGRAAMDDPVMADFVATLDRVNALADASPGFVWRLQDDSGNATAIAAYDDPNMLVNMSVWRDADALFDFVYRSGHTPVMARRRDWFLPLDGPYMVLWWVAAGHRPDVAEAQERLARLAAHGPTADAFTFKARFDPPADAA